MKKYIIEREIPGVGGLAGTDGLCDAARQSNAALSAVGPGIQWQHSYLAGDKTFCVYLAENEELIREHAAKSGFPATKITEIKAVFDPSTGDAPAESPTSSRTKAGASA
jgi:hypothetical protein